jgi:hypothetical protein
LLGGVDGNVTILNCHQCFCRICFSGGCGGKM